MVTEPHWLALPACLRQNTRPSRHLLLPAELKASWVLAIWRAALTKASADYPFGICMQSELGNRQNLRKCPWWMVHLALSIGKNPYIDNLPDCANPYPSDYRPGTTPTRTKTAPILLCGCWSIPRPEHVSRAESLFHIFSFDLSKSPKVTQLDVFEKNQPLVQQPGVDLWRALNLYHRRPAWTRCLIPKRNDRILLKFHNRQVISSIGIEMFLVVLDGTCNIAGETRAVGP